MSLPLFKPENVCNAENVQKVTLLDLFVAWFLIGLTSFGGGQSTLSLIQRKLSTQNGWITDNDFARANAMAQIAPGINLIAITMLLGSQLGGAAGVVVSVIGLLTPSVVITTLMTAGYAQIRNQPIVLHIFHGIIPATVGIGAFTGLTMLTSLIKSPGSNPKTIEILTCSAILVASFILIQNHAPVIVVMLGGGAILGLVHSTLSKSLSIKDGAAIE